MILGYTLEAPMAEREFLRRELGVQWCQISLESISNVVHENWTRNEPTLIIVSNPNKYIEVFLNAPEGSLVLFLISDESYLRSYRKLSQSSSVREVFRNYGIEAIGFRRGICAIAYWYPRVEKDFACLVAFIRVVVQGFRSQLRMLAWRLVKKPVHVCPLGYTEKFSKALCELIGSLDPLHSLFEQEIKYEVDRIFDVCFRGNQGQLQRRVMIREIQETKCNYDLHVVDSEWSGVETSRLSGPDYVLSLLKSKTALCPPGYSNNESFRYYEALLCGALPMEAQVAISHMGILPARPDLAHGDSVQARLVAVRSALREVRASLNHALQREFLES